jgi:hypothetical protein
MEESKNSEQLPVDQAREARFGVITFLFLLVLGSAVLYSLIVSEHQTNRRFVLVALLLIAPAPVSIVTRLWREEGFTDVSFRLLWRSGGTPLILAWLIPIVIGAVAYGLAWVTGQAVFAAPSVEGARVAYLGSGSGVRFGILLLVSTTLGATIYLPLALGTELGWRGYVLFRLIDSHVRRPILVSGLLWGLWQIPLVLAGDIAPSSHQLATCGLFLIVLVAFSYLTAWLRVASGSIWPPVVFSASWNSTVSGAYAAATEGHSAWVGVAGINVAVVTTALAVFIAWRTWPIAHVPDEDTPPRIRLSTL